MNIRLVGPVARDESTSEFFDAAAGGRFLISRCVPAGHANKPQAHVCSKCGSRELRRQPASGRAHLVSWVVVPDRAGAGSPRVPAIAQLEEGPWWWSILIGADPSRLCVGMPLRIDFARAEGGEPIPVFVPE
jgi:uncharacterized OB-fold protein